MNRTKKAICEVFWQLLEEKPYNKITVQDIVNRCQVNRNTFYYHFQDIPALTEYSIKAFSEDIIEKNYYFESPVDCILPLAQELITRKRAFIHIYHSACGETLIQYFNKVCYDIVASYVNNTPQNVNVSEEDKKFYIHYHKCIWAGIILDWISSGASYDLLEFCRKVCHSFEGFGNIAFFKLVMDQYAPTTMQ
ncbi:MAG: TetR family transcriptional regulator [Lachnospiraceae bacterium]|nr:TetR family transcriptional regulator [Lachnospiraceae bacterium]